MAAAVHFAVAPPDGFESWGEDEWASLAAELARVFPDRQPIELWPEHEVFWSFYAIGERPGVRDSIVQDSCHPRTCAPPGLESDGCPVDCARRRADGAAGGGSRVGGPRAPGARPHDRPFSAGKCPFDEVERINGSLMVQASFLEVE